VKGIKVLLIYPYILERGEIPISLTLFTAVLRKAGHRVKIFDCSQYTTETDLRSIKESICMFKAASPPPVIRPPKKNIENLDNDLVEVLTGFAPTIVGITVTSGSYPLGLACSKIVKKHDAGIKVILGGIHSTVCPEEVITEESVDIVCIGEGEDALLELCEAIKNKKQIVGIRNLWVKDRHKSEVVYRNELRPLKDLNTLPTQDLSDFHEYDFYRPLDGNMYRMVNTELSRGCIFKCSYCSNQYLQDLFQGYGSYHRRKDPEVAVNQLKEIKERYGFNAVRFWDEDFTVFPLSYLSELAKLYRNEVGLPFVVYAGTRTITEEKVRCLKEMGCITIAMAIESGSHWVRKYILNRDISDEEIIKKYDIVKRSGIRVSAYNMIGLPFETRKMVFDTIRLNRKVKPATSSVAVYMPYPKTCLSEIAQKYGLIKGTCDYNSVSSCIDSPYLSKDEIDGLVRTFALYTKVPEELFPVLEKCEKDESLAKKLFPVLSQCAIE